MVTNEIIDVEVIEKDENVAATARVDMKADSSLKDTIEQILINNFHDSIDEMKDYYNREIAAINESLNRHSEEDEEKKESKPTKIKLAMLGVFEYRLQILKELSNSFEQTFNTQENKTIKSPSYSTIDNMQKNYKSKMGNMDVPAIANQMMDRMYHVDVNTEAISGIIPEIAEYLAIQAQEEMLKTGQIDFNLYKQASKQMLENISEKSNIAENISKDNYVLDRMFVKADKLLRAAKTRFNADNFNTEDLEQFIEDYKDLGKELEYTLIYDACEDVLDCVRKTKEICERAKLAQKSGMPKEEYQAKKEELRQEISQQQKFVKNHISSLGKANAQVAEEFDKKHIKIVDDKLILKTKGTRPLTDKLIIDALAYAGASRAVNGIEKFDYTEKDSEKETDALKNYIDLDRTSKIDVTYDMLINMVLQSSYIRAKYEKDTDEYKKSHETICMISKIIEKRVEGITTGDAEIQKITEKSLNNFIEISQYTQKGEKREKVGLQKVL